MIKLTNGAQVADTAIIAHVTAEIDGGYVRDRVTVTQYDDKMPVVAVSLMYQNRPYVPPDGAALNVRMRKTDGKGVYNPCIGTDADGVVYLAITQQMTAAHGNSTFTVEVSVDGGVKNTPPIGIAINPNPVQEGQIESEDEFLTLQEILAQCQKYGQIVEANAANIQTVKDNLDAIKAAPAAADRAEQAAKDAENSAAESKGFRTFHGAVVPDSNGNLDPSRPMTVGPAASVEIESAGDRIQSVTAFGFTAQAGSGDPSPSNVRQLTNGGLKLVELSFDGTENWSFASVSGGNAFQLSVSVAAKADATSALSVFAFAKPVSYNDRGGYPNFWRTYMDGQLFTVRAPNGDSTTLAGFKSILSAAKSAGKPAKGWYVPADESQATGLYAPIILQGGEYRATCLELTTPLCEGDSVVSWAKSGCDKVLVLTGTENWQSTALSGNPETTYYWFAITDGSGNSSKSGPVLCNIANSNSLGVYNELLDVGSKIGFGVQWAKNNGIESVGDIKSKLAALYEAGNPAVMYHRSTNYTEAADIPVSLETHQRAVLVLDGTESFTPNNASSWPSGYAQFYAPTKSYPGSTNRIGTCSHCKYGSPAAEGELSYTFVDNSGGVYLRMPKANVGETAESCKAYLAAQYAAGTPVTIVYQLATTITYAHPAVVLEAATGDQLTYTVTGQSGGTVSVALKPFQDGGHAAMADSATTAQNANNATTAQNANNATTAQNANNATQFDGHAWSEVPGQAPVQSVNGQTGAVMLTAASVGAVPTAQIDLGTLTSPTQLPAQGVSMVHFDSSADINANASSAPFTDYAVGDFYGVWLGQSSKVYGTLLITSPRFDAYFWVAQVWESKFTAFKKIGG